MKTIIAVLFLVISCQLCFSQKLSGRWQAQTPEISDTYLGNYLFSKTTFEYTINGYDGLNPIQVLGGTYLIKSDSIYFTVEYMKKLIGGELCRSEIYTQNDSWAFEGGTIKTINLVSPIHAVASIKLTEDVIWIGKRKFCKLNVKDDN